jgi:hypothetical protein
MVDITVLLDKLINFEESIDEETPIEVKCRVDDLKEYLIQLQKDLFLVQRPQQGPETPKRFALLWEFAEKRSAAN